MKKKNHLAVSTTQSSRLGSGRGRARLPRQHPPPPFPPHSRGPAHCGSPLSCCYWGCGHKCWPHCSGDKPQGTQGRGSLPAGAVGTKCEDVEGKVCSPAVPESRNTASLSLSLHPGNTERPGDESFTTSEALGGPTGSDRAPHPPALTVHPIPPLVQLPIQPDLSPGAQPLPAPEAHPAWPSRGARAAQSQTPLSTHRLCPLRVSVSPRVPLALTFPAGPSLSPPAPTLHWACGITAWGPGTPPPHRCPGTGVRLFRELVAPLGLSQQFWQAHSWGSARVGRGHVASGPGRAVGSVLWRHGDGRRPPLFQAGALAGPSRLCRLRASPRGR